MKRVLSAEGCPDVKACFCKGRRYTCPGCKRFVPWCFGAADAHPEVCDDCWGQRERAKEGRVAV